MKFLERCNFINSANVQKLFAEKCNHINNIKTDNLKYIKEKIATCIYIKIINFIMIKILIKERFYGNIS